MSDKQSTGPGENGPEVFPTSDELPDEPLAPADISPFSVADSDVEDIDEFATAEWKASTTADERIRAVIKRTATPKTVTEIADTAAVSESKARTALKSLSGEGVATSRNTESGVVYQRNPDRHLIEQLHQLANSGDTVDRIQEVKAELAEYRETYGTDSPEELLVSDKDLSGAELTDVSHWRTAVRDLEYLRAAYRIQEAKRQTPANGTGSETSDDVLAQ